MSRVLLRSLLLLALGTAAVLGNDCGGGNPLVPASHPEALVVYNTNAGDDAREIAEYYASERKVPADRLCPVELPTGQLASTDHLLAARKTILEQCICAILPADTRPSPCSIANVDAIRLASPITHLALIRGIPPRLYGTPWPTSAEEPSFDFYLAYSLYRPENLFTAGTTGVPTSTYLSAGLLEQGSQGMILSAPPLSTAQHREVAYGRIEALDRDRTLQLVDRIVLAEERGLEGSFFEERNNKDFRFLRDTTGSFDPACSGYLTHQPFLPGTPESTWPPATCRAGTTWTQALGPNAGTPTDDPIRSIVPGTWMSTIPFAVNAGLLLGSAPNPNSHAGFTDFATLTRWRRSEAACTPLCADLPTQAERDECTAASPDVFHELNAACVGTARGFLGHQVRSYPVQFYGFYPPGWESRTIGAVEKTAPEIREGGAYVDDNFRDDRYLHFGHGGVDDASVPSCPTVAGGSLPCPERVAVSLEHRIALPTPIPVEGSRWFVLRLRHRNAASPGGRLNAALTFEGGATPVTVSVPLALDAEQLGWTMADLLFSASGASTPQITGITLTLAASLADGLQGFLDLDAIQLFDIAGGTELVATPAGSFDPARRDTTTWGDWAANAIDRLGAVAFWGSSSHHVANGFALSDEGRFYGAFFMGRTLGESLALMAGGESAIVYGDPLFRPVAVRIHIPGQGGYGKAPGLAVGPSQLSLHLVNLEVLHGTAHATSTRWALDSCPVLDPAACEGQWVERLTGQGSVSGNLVDWTAFIDRAVAQDLLLRLRVWNPGEEASELRHHAYFRWVP